MLSLQDILYKVPLVEVRGDTSVEIEDFFFDSREVQKGSLFVAVRGTQVDGHKYIEGAIKKGAVAVVCEEFPEGMENVAEGEKGEGAISLDNVGPVMIKVKDSGLALSFIAANFYENPAEELKVIGVTGTNGKTTCATLLYELFNGLGYPAGLFSTVSIRNRDKEIPATHTTPDAKQLHKIFSEMLGDGCEFVFMEVSSHALHQKRVASIPFAGAVFTNITHDHLDYHKSFDEYIAAKKILFDSLPSTSFALTNNDDRNGQVMLQNCSGSRHGYGIKKVAEFKGRIIENTFEGLQLDIDNQEVWCRLIGSFNAYNLLAVYGTAALLEISKEEILIELSKLGGVNGRFQQIQPPGARFSAIVDYAHTPDALKNVLKTIKDISGDGGKVITVVGCGGNRDKDKRPKMAKIAVELSDQVVFTSDNPRDEEPSEILREMNAGVPVSLRRRVLTIENRREAIAVAVKLAQDNDVILVAGKGHESYQEVKGVKNPFDDREVLIESFKTLN